MILWRFKEIPEDRGDGYPCSAFRWTLQLGWAFFGLSWQVQDKKTREWRDSDCAYYQIGFSRRPRWGITHCYYDGPHCALSIGFLRFDWTGDPRTQWCEKCMPSDGSDNAIPEPVAPKISDICPVCENTMDVPDGGAGDELTCTACGAALVIEEWQDGSFSLVSADEDAESDVLTEAE